MDAVTVLARARVYQVLALGYAYPSDGQRQRMRMLLDGAGEWAEVVGAPWPSALDGLAAQVTGVEPEAVEQDFNRLFSGPVDCSPHETAYEPDIFRRQRILADLGGFYEAFGMDLGQSTRWQPDHLGVQLEFCAVVLQRHVLALEEGWEEPAEVCRRALTAFLEDHTGRWHRAFGRRLHRLAGVGLYRTLAVVTERWVGAELERFGLRPEPLADRPRIAPDDDASPECGACPAASGTGPGPRGPA